MGSVRVTSYFDLKLTSKVIVEAKANANPAVDALMAGERTMTKPAIPTTAADNMLKRAESHRFTNQLS